MPSMKLTLQNSRALRFFLVGAVNSIFGFLVFSALVLFGAGNLPALVGGNLLGLVFNFFSTGGLVFKNLSPSNIPKFVGCYIAMLAINTIALNIFAPLLGSRIGAQALLTLPMAGIAYAVMSLWVFRSAKT